MIRPVVSELILDASNLVTPSLPRRTKPTMNSPFLLYTLNFWGSDIYPKQFHSFLSPTAPSPPLTHLTYYHQPWANLSLLVATPPPLVVPSKKWRWKNAWPDPLTTEPTYSTRVRDLVMVHSAGSALLRVVRMRKTPWKLRLLFALGRSIKENFDMWCL